MKSIEIGKVKGAVAGVEDKLIILEMTNSGPRILVTCSKCGAVLITVPITQYCPVDDIILTKYDDVDVPDETKLKSMGEPK